MLDQLDTLLAFTLIMLLLSLLITTFVQAFNVALQRRGFILLWGVKQILNQMEVDNAKIDGIAERILNDPAICAGGLLKKIPIIGDRIPIYAQAIRADELARLLSKVLKDTNVVTVAERAQAWYEPTLAAANSLIKVMSSDSTALAAGLQAVGAGALGNQVHQLLPGAVQASVTPANLEMALNTVCAALATQPTIPVESALQTIGIRVLAALPAPAAPPAAGAAVTADLLRNAIERTFTAQMAKTRQDAAKLKAWFDLVMDRTTERFVAWSRTVSIIVSFIFCLVLQIDALDILERLNADKQLRATLVAQVDPTIKEAKDILDLASASLGSRALKDMAKDLKSAGSTKEIPADLDTRAKGENWLNENIKDPQERQKLISIYGDRFDALAVKRLDELGATRKELLKKLNDTQLQLFPTSGEFAPRAWAYEVFCDPRHLGGILMAGMLLSLGAPFWFNMLKNLSNLRPILAGRVEKPSGEPSSAAPG